MLKTQQALSMFILYLKLIQFLAGGSEQSWPAVNIQAVSRLKSHLDYGAFLPMQFAAAHALEAGPSITREVTKIYHQRLKACTSGLSRLGWSIELPKAGACVWGRPPKTNGNLENFPHHLLQRAGVLVSPGKLFGAEYSGWVRIAAVVEEDRLRDVLKRIEVHTK